MGTQGLFGFVYKGKYYLVYNHWDSYPEGLGSGIVEELKRAIENNQLEEWKKLLVQIKEVSEDVPPTPEEIQKLQCYSNTSVSTGSLSDWYCLLRNCQGSLEKVLESGYIVNSGPAWEDFGYVLNFDTNKLDFYIGSELEQSYGLDNLPKW